MAGCIVRQLLFCTLFIHVTQVTIIKEYLLNNSCLLKLPRRMQSDPDQTASEESPSLFGNLTSLYNQHFIADLKDISV